jgi:hypothetical protein
MFLPNSVVKETKSGEGIKMGFLSKHNVSKQENKIKTGFIFKHNILNKKNKNKSWVSFQKSYFIFLF